MINSRKHTLVALTLVSALAAQSALACKAPTSPRAMPDGRSADIQVMQQAKLQVEQYLEQVTTYFSCERNALRLQEVSEEQKLVMSRYNAEVRAFHAANRVAAARPASFTSN